MLARARQLKNDEGFTLVELLIVIVILGVLSAVVVFSVAGISDKGTAAACDADKATIATAAEAFHAFNNSYPKIKSDLEGSFLAVGAIKDGRVAFDNTGAEAPTVSC